MNKKSKGALTPKLRFPEFRGSEPWKRRRLSDFLVERKQRNRNLKYNAQDVLSVSGEHGCVNQIKLLGRSYAGVSVKEYHVVEAGDIVYTKSPLKNNPFGIIKENKGVPGIVSTLYAVYRSIGDGHPAFFDHYFSSDYNLNSYLEPIVKKGAKNDMKVNNTAVLGGVVLAPTLPEQKKIAECLSSLDELVTAEGRKLEALKAHKAGLMQQLFLQPGKTQPRLRFPEFRGKGEWKVLPLCELARRITTRNANLGQSRVLTNSAELGVIDQGRYFDREIVTKGNLDKYYVVKKGDFVYNPRISNVAPVGPVSRNDLGIGVMSPLYTVFRFATPLTDYFAQLFKTSVWHQYLKETSNSGARHDRISITAVSFMNVPLPVPSAKEQQKIIDCLSALDTLIAAQASKIESLKQHKRGLMQHLFPAPEEQ